MSEMTLCEERAEFFRNICDATLIERMFSYLPDVVFCLKDENCIYRSANDAFAERVGLGSRWEVVGKTALDLFPPPLGDHYRQQDEEVISTGQGFRERLELVPSRNGRLGWFLATKEPIFDTGGRVVGIASLSCDLRIPSGQENGYRELAQVVAEIENHFSESLSKAEYARKAGLSELQFDRRLKRVFGLSFQGLLKKLRIEHGSRLLVESQRPLIEIAHECGYSEQSAFSRVFKSTVGIPPGRYRDEFKGWW
jgi:PAS domain S-box-containing protein